MKKNIFRQDIISIKPYISSPKIENGIKLDAGENPFMENFLNKNLVQSIPFYRYPDTNCETLRKKLSDYTGVNTDMILCGNGSDELIDLIIRSCVNKNDEMIVSPPTFPMYEFYGKLSRAKIIKVLRNKDLTVNSEKICNSVTSKTKLIFIDSPGNPAGTIISPKDVESVLKTNVIVVIDEAYFEYCGKSALQSIEKFDNLIILRTFSKWAGIAGLRLGYLIADKKVINTLLKIKSPYNVNSISQSVSCQILDKKEKYLKKIKKIVSFRDAYIKLFRSIPDIFVYPSNGAYIVVKPKERADKMQLYLQKQRVIVKILNQPLMQNCLRINIGKEIEMQKVIQLIKRFYGKKYAFLDRDGTLIFEPPDTYQIDSIQKLKILDGVIRGLKMLIKKGYELVMVSNQDGLGTTIFPKANFEAPQNKMLSVFEENGITFKKIFICPHLPSKKCDCRKPKIGLVKKFIKENLLEKNKSFVYGDRESDKIFAKNIGVRFIPMKTNGDFYKALTQKGEFI